MVFQEHMLINKYKNLPFYKYPKIWNDNKPTDLEKTKNSFINKLKQQILTSYNTKCVIKNCFPCMRTKI